MRATRTSPALAACVARLATLFCLAATALGGALPTHAAQEQIVASYYFGDGKPERAKDVPAERLTHLIYAFATLCGIHPQESTEQQQCMAAACAGKAPFAAFLPDEEKQENELAALAALKDAHPHLKIYLSIGGWGLSAPFHDMIGSSAGRRAFAKSAVALLASYPLFDGVDIDWEYPGGGDKTHPRLDAAGIARERRGYTRLMNNLRAELDRLGAETGRTYALSAAVSAADIHIDTIDWKRVIKRMDYVFVMTYDLAVESGKVNHNANLFGSEQTAWRGADRMVNNLLDAGVPARKIVLGVPFYGRYWSNVAWDSELGFQDQDQSVFLSTQSYRDILAADLEREGYVLVKDSRHGAIFYYDKNNAAFVSFDDPALIAAKAAWARDKGLAGVFSWQIFGDTDDAALTRAMRWPPTAAKSETEGAEP